MSTQQLDQWKEVRPGQSVPMMQGYALNLLASKFHPRKMEMGFLTDKDFGYRLTLPDGRQAIYVDRGDCLELVDSVNLTRMICEEHLS